MMQTNADDSITQASETVEHAVDPVVESRTERRGGGSAAIALLLAVIAAGAAGYAAWRVWIIDRGDENQQAQLTRQLDALEARVGENERRSARNNELAATLRDQLTENARLRDRMREDLIALADRSARAEALLADLARQQRGPGERLAVDDASLLLAQADVRLRLYGDREGAHAALQLAESALAGAGSTLSDLRAAVADASASLAADSRPSQSSLLTELDEIAQAIEPLELRIVRTDASNTAASGQGWWARQLDSLDRLVTIRRETDAESDATPTKTSVLQALQRARLAALEQNNDVLARALVSARTSLLACCEPESAQPLVARLDRLIGIEWNAAMPDLHALRQRLDNRAAIDQAAETGAVPMEPADAAARREDTP